jgi:hypothetical protein
MAETLPVNDWIESRRVKDGHTRDCFYPWDTVFIHADRSVRVCCTSAVIAQVEPDWDLEALANGPEFVEFRKNFIAGLLTPQCHICTIRPEIPVDEFKGKLSDYLSSKPPSPFTRMSRAIVSGLLRRGRIIASVIREQARLRPHNARPARRNVNRG